MSTQPLLAVVTGGTGALGAAVVGTLLERGWRVCVPVYREEELAAFPHRDRAQPVTGVDLAEEAQALRFFREQLPAGELRASIHVAGGFAMAPLVETGLRDFEHMMRMNAVTAFLAAREAAQRMKTNAPDVHGVRGRIVNVAAQVGIQPLNGGGMTAYTGSKAAVAALTQAAAGELRGDGIWVNAVVPSIIDTPANREAMPKAPHARWPKPDQIARTIAFLAGEENAVTTGALVPVHGFS